jgi:chromosomal replication initiation ATPase DnaA
VAGHLSGRAFFHGRMNGFGMRSGQIPLSLPHSTALGRADFIVGAANAEALALIDRWPDWPSRTVLLAGPIGSGKSHLVEIWRAASGADVVAASAVDALPGDLPPAAGAIAIEDLHSGPLDETALFHLLNTAAERKATVLMTSRAWPSALPLKLSDLVSRLRASHVVELAEPDDELLRRVLTKLFSDRQVTIERSVVEFIVTRMERSLETANSIVELLDREALARGRAITIPFTADVLGPPFGQQGNP